MNRPPFLFVGNLIKIQSYWCAEIKDIADTEVGRIMLLLKSPKGIWRNKPEEWIEYSEGQIVPASFEEAESDIETHRLRINRMLIDIDDLEKEWIQER
jgi:hypothetical protein